MRATFISKNPKVKTTSGFLQGIFTMVWMILRYEVKIWMVENGLTNNCHIALKCKTNVEGFLLFTWNDNDTELRVKSGRKIETWTDKR